MFQLKTQKIYVVKQNWTERGQTIRALLCPVCFCAWLCAIHVLRNYVALDLRRRSVLIVSKMWIKCIFFFAFCVIGIALEPGLSPYLAILFTL